ncbi:hypothetical protein [Bifidobacterium biavatii]|uniref:hypothetical protein n=1 Tax=Bifidobacterium biavatii TaxID=762212 RepID=UPI001269BC45|nr:hypothetical protein [Bifidobacterium biavatii]
MLKCAGEKTVLCVGVDAVENAAVHGDRATTVDGNTSCRPFRVLVLNAPFYNVNQIADRNVTERTAVDGEGGVVVDGGEAASNGGGFRAGVGERLIVGIGADGESTGVDNEQGTGIVTILELERGRVFLAVGIQGDTRNEGDILSDCNESTFGNSNRLGNVYRSAGFNAGFEGGPVGDGGAVASGCGGGGVLTAVGCVVVGGFVAGGSGSIRGYSIVRLGVGGGGIRGFSGCRRVGIG